MTERNPMILAAPLRQTLIAVAICLIAGLTGPKSMAASPVQGEDLRTPQSLDGSKNAGQRPLRQETGTEQAASDATEVSQQQRFEMLLREMDNLIPGEFAPESPEKKAVAQAITAFQNRDAQRVIEIFKGLEAANADFPPTNLMLAGLSYAIKDVDNGNILLERAAIQSPESPAVYTAFARIAIAERRATDANALLEKLERVLAASKLSQSAKDFYGLQLTDGQIDVAMQQRRYDEARTLLEQQRAATTETPKMLMIAAELEFRDKNLEKSLALLRKFKAGAPQASAPEAVIASWYEMTNDPEEANNWMVKAASLYPRDLKTQLAYANWAIDREEFNAATAAINKADAVDPTLPLTRNLKAKIAFANESFPIAEAHYEALTKQQPGNFDASNMYALTLIESGDPEKEKQALALANRNYRALPGNVIAQAALGYILLKTGDIENAKKALGQASRAQADSPELDFFFGSLLKEMNEKEQAVLAVKKAIDHEGFFLYRSAARRLLGELEGSELPKPGESGPAK